MSESSWDAKERGSERTGLLLGDVELLGKEAARKAQAMVWDEAAKAGALDQLVSVLCADEARQSAVLSSLHCAGSAAWLSDSD